MPLLLTENASQSTPPVERGAPLFLRRGDVAALSDPSYFSRSLAIACRASSWTLGFLSERRGSIAGIAVLSARTARVRQESRFTLASGLARSGRIAGTALALPMP